MNVLLGIWIVISPFVLGFSNRIPLMWNNVATGAAIFLLALSRSKGTYGPSAVVVLLGIWLLISPFVLVASLTVVAVWNDAILGIIVALVALTSSIRRPLPKTVIESAGPTDHQP